MTTVNNNNIDDIEKQLPPVQDRDHDTITSLNNQAYLKKLRQVKNNSSSRLTLNSAFSTDTSTAPSTPNSAIKNPPLFRGTSNGSNHSLVIPPSLISLFKKQHTSSETDSLIGMVLETQTHKSEPIVDSNK